MWAIKIAYHQDDSELSMCSAPLLFREVEGTLVVRNTVLYHGCNTLTNQVAA